MYHLDDESTLDAVALLSGLLEIRTRPIVRAYSLLSRREVRIDAREIAALLEIPRDRWVTAQEAGRTEPSIPPERLEAFARDGLVLCDRPEAPYEALFELHENMLATGWNVAAAAYHFLTKREGMSMGFNPRDDLNSLARGLAISEEALDRLIEERGSPPPAFHTTEGDSIELPLGEEGGSALLFDLLARRKTTRSFNRKRRISCDMLSSVLRLVFGCLGTSSLYGRAVFLKRTSPSAGALHPVEAYPLVLGVDDIEPGLYHYDARLHALERIRRMTISEAEDAASAFTMGQTFAASAQALFLLTARFSRSYWKYRDNPRTYGTVLMDLGHLSQTLYLVCAQKGLGAFLTAAINEVDIERALGVDGVAESAIAICGCGVPLGQPTGLEPDFEPFVPRATSLGR